MSQYQRLLLIIDPALRHSPAIHHAAALAKASGASLHIAALIKPVELMSLLDPRVRVSTRDSYLQAQGQWLKDEAHGMQGRGIAVTTEIAWADDVREEILQHVTEMRPDLLIKEVWHESAFKRAFITPLDWQLLRQCPVPVYLVGASGHGLPHRVVAAVDPSRAQSNELNEQIIQQANSLALQCDAELHLLHAGELSPEYLEDSNGDVLVLANLRKDVRRRLETAFLDLADRFGVPVERRHLLLGQPVTVLSRFASEHQVDVFVMGRAPHHGLHRWVGSTTEHLMYQVPCSILAV